MFVVTWMPNGGRILDKIAINQKSWRLIPSCYPPIQLFEDLLDPADLEAAYELESLTNDRLRDEVGDIYRIPSEDRLVGPGTTAIMAAFSHTGFASRFTDGSFGIYYAGLSPETALSESMHSQERRLALTSEPAQVVQMRCYVATTDATLCDVRNDSAAHAEDWGHAQSLGRKLFIAREAGILYKSLRHSGGSCVAALRTTAITPPATQGGHYEFHWDGKGFTHYSLIQGVTP